ncbi:MAG: TrkA C-terminal domain-containing protein [Deltaproteobacteria bacterium]|nr:TrkA C-terminal domain-containing protein [Deltaproteobacteria bacterium]
MEVQRSHGYHSAGAQWYLFHNDDDYRVLSHLRGAEQQFDLQWIRIAAQSPIIHQSIGESQIRKKTGASVVGVVRGDGLCPIPMRISFYILTNWLPLSGERNIERASR